MHSIVRVITFKSVSGFTTRTVISEVTYLSSTALVRAPECYIFVPEVD